MPANSSTTDLIQRRWQSLSDADRKAILAHFDEDELARMQDQLDELDRGAAGSQRYRAYSAWLGKIIQACERGQPEADSLTQATGEALLAAHEALRERPTTFVSGISLSERLFEVLQRWRAGK